jgi:hypothetical protein
MSLVLVVTLSLQYRGQVFLPYIHPLNKWKFSICWDDHSLLFMQYPQSSVGLHLIFCFLAATSDLTNPKAMCMQDPYDIQNPSVMANNCLQSGRTSLRTLCDARARPQTDFTDNLRYELHDLVQLHGHFDILNPFSGLPVPHPSSSC